MDSSQKIRYVDVTYSSNGKTLEVNCELETGRKVHHVKIAKATCESPPHGAGSFHDPSQHAIYMDRVEALFRGK